jgi:hypothetical protein
LALRPGLLFRYAEGPNRKLDIVVEREKQYKNLRIIAVHKPAILSLEAGGPEPRRAGVSPRQKHDDGGLCERPSSSPGAVSRSGRRGRMLL